MIDVINELQEKSSWATTREASLVYEDAAKILMQHEVKAINKRRAKNKRAKNARKAHRK